MKKSTIWQSIVSILIIILAVLILLNIQHPTWAKNLLVWQAEGQREIAWRYGTDLGNNHRVTLVPEETSPVQMQTTLAVIENRAKSLSPTTPVVELSDDRITVQAPSSLDLAVLTQTLQAPGLVEFINAGEDGPESRVVETTLGGPPNDETVELAAEAPTIYETVMTNADLEYIALEPLQSPSYKYSIRFKLTPSGDMALLDFNQNHPTELICITLDKLVLICNYSSGFMEKGRGGDHKSPVAIAETEAASISARLDSGRLPLSLQVGSVESAGPALGEETVRQIAVATIIALAAALVFLLVHYRLLGLVVALVLAFFALLSLALYKILPVPITLSTITGLAATGLATLGTLLPIAEHLSKRARDGQDLPQTIKAAFSKTRPSILSTHLALGVLAITTWLVALIVAAQTIYWLGVSLIVGTSISLFTTMIFSHALFDLVTSIKAVQRLLNERKWLLGA